jgi:acetoin utilization deacetylase AcuC-like enzyme
VRAWARIRRSLQPQRLDIVYSPSYRLRLGGTPIDPYRAEKVLSFLMTEGVIGRRSPRAPREVSLKTLAAVHTDDYLDHLHRPSALVPIIGFDVDDELQDKALRAQRSAVGGTSLATRLALQGRRLAVNLGGGFHHARPDAGAGFCIFNDVAVAVWQARSRGFDGAVLVVDLDLHDGDGTRAVFADDPSVFTFSVHNRHWDDAEAVASEAIELGGDIEDDRYLTLLAERLPALCELVRPGLVFYVAGADPAHDDALGNWHISDHGMLARDRLVFETLEDKLGEVPTVIVLAGGYGKRSWRHTARSLAWLLTGNTLEPPTNEDLTLERYREVFAELDSEQLTRPDPARDSDFWGLSESDIFGDLMGSKRGTRLLGHFSTHGVELVLERCGLLDSLRDLGFARPHVRFDLDNPAGETVRVFGDASQRELLIEVRLRRTSQAASGLELLSIEWLLMQNPRRAWGPGRGPLPGQTYPGLGMLSDMMALLIIMCEQLDLDGISFVPSHYHLASKGKKYLRFLDPADEAWYRVMRAAVAELSLAEATKAVDSGRVVDLQGRPIAWRPMLMLLPISSELRTRVDGDEYEAAVEARQRQLDFELLSG